MKIYQFESFALKMDGNDRVALYYKRQDDFGNDYFQYNDSYAINSRNSGKIFAEVIKLKEEIEHLKFHLKVQDNIK